MIKHQEIQSLINEIDNVLPKASSDEPRRLHPEDIARQHRVLERVHSYLVSLLSQPESSSPAPTSTLNPTEQETAWRIAQAAIAHIQQHSPDARQPIQGEIESLKQQRDTLRQDIQNLQNQQQQLIHNFLQDLKSRLPGSVPNNVAKNSPSSQFASEQVSASLIEHQHLEQLQQQSEQRLLNLDATFRAVFEALEGDLQSYRTSLSRGLEEMHSLGRQGEALFSGYFQKMLPQLSTPQNLNPPEQDLSEVSPPSMSEDWEEDQETTTADHFSNLAPPLETMPFAGIELVNTNREIVREPFPSEEETQSLEEGTLERLMSMDLEENVSENSFPSQEENLEGYESLFAEESPTPNVFGEAFSNTSSETEVQEVEQESIVAEDTQQEIAPESENWSIEEALFGGIADPGEFPESDFSETLASEEITAETKTLRNDESNAMSAKLGEGIVLPESEAFATEAEAVETIQQLTDLLTETGWNREDSVVVEAREEWGDSESNEENDYPLVAPEESLLTEQPSKSSSEPELEQFLDSETLQQLSEDLEHFEESENQQQQPSRNIEEEYEVSAQPWNDIELSESSEGFNPEENEMQSNSSASFSEFSQDVSFFVEEIATSPWERSSVYPEDEGDVTDEEENEQ